MGTFAVGNRGGKGGTLKYPNHPWPGVPLYVVFCCPLPPKVAENFQPFLAKLEILTFFSIQRKFCPGQSPSHLSIVAIVFDLIGQNLLSLWQKTAVLPIQPDPMPTPD